MNHRLVPLEACRGIAALIVLVSHFLLAFAPTFTGYQQAMRTPDSLVGAPWFFVFNGGAAVSFFFVLSGFVLSWAYFRTEDASIMARGFLKRWPRLAGVVTVVTVSSWLLFATGAYHFAEAARLTGSPWLASFASSTPETIARPSFVAALVQGVTTFFTGYASYNTNLWTMRPEFFGSLLVYIGGPFIVQTLGRRRAPLAFLILFLATHMLFVSMAPFLAGMALSLALSRREVSIGLLPALTIAVLGLYCLGYVAPEGSYAWGTHLPEMLRMNLRLALHVAGSVCVIFVLIANRQIFGWFNGPISAYLGKLSFPIYLVHIPVICSVSSLVYLTAATAGYSASALLGATFATTLVASLLISIPLHWFDEWWVKVVNKASTWARA